MYNNDKFSSQATRAQSSVFTKPATQYLKALSLQWWETKAANPHTGELLILIVVEYISAHNTHEIS